jgi:hypothetical protein
MIKLRLNPTFERTSRKLSEPPTPALETTPTDYPQIVRETAETLFQYVAVSVAGYMILDTFRKCAIKATPQR